ncbi:MAG: N-acetylmuramoyl-L-alanine amidase, partial [Bacteroidota bacterium]
RFETMDIRFGTRATASIGVNGKVNDVSIRPQYAEWELAKGSRAEQRNAIYLSIHSNGSGGSGTESYIHSFKPVYGSKLLQQAVHGELIKDLRSGWNRSWINRGQKAADFGELRGLQTMPGLLVELGFHDHPQDAEALTTPDFRDLSARAIYKGIVRYYAKKQGKQPVFLPEPPTAVVARNDGKGKVTLRWNEGAYGGIHGSRAQKFKVYISHHGRAFADYEVTTNNIFTFRNLQKNTSYYFRVSAVNEGGESFPSATVAVRTPDPKTDAVQYLIVDGYDRLERAQAHVVYEARPRFRPLGKVRRLPLEQMNDYSYATEHAEALAQAGIWFDGTDNEALLEQKISLQDYDGVDWFTGRESVNHETLSARERALLTMYLQKGGRLIISGSELGYHLAKRGKGKVFYEKYLKAAYRGDNAAASQFIGRNRSNFRGLNGHFRSTSSTAYPVNSPDYMEPINGGEALMKYSTGKTAAIGYQGKYGLLHFAFPLEMIADERLRNEMFLRSLEYLHPPKIKQRDKKRRNDLADGR